MTPNSAVRLAIANVVAEGLDDVLRPPFEVWLIQTDQETRKQLETITRQKIETYLSAGSKRVLRDAFDNLSLMPLSHVLVPKKEAFDYRKVAIIRPEDLLLFLATAIMIAEPFELARSRIARGKVFSYRYKPLLKKGQLFKPEHNFRSFQAKSAEISRRNSFKYVVRGDIANFYDRINIHRLESTLSTTHGLDKRTVELMNQMLLHWARRDSYGLPIGSNASRILAEVALFNVDKALREAGLTYVRFVDDYRIFAKNAAEAHSALARLMELLGREGLFINSRKSSIERLSKEKVEKVSATEKVVRREKSESKTFRIVAGYGGTIPIKFRIPSSRVEEKYRNVDLTALATEIQENDFAFRDQLRDFLYGIVAQEEYEELSVACALVERFPQFYPLLVDLLIKKAESISSEIKIQIIERLSRKLRSDDFLPEYLKASLIDLVGSKQFFDRNAVMHVIRNLRWNAGAYLARAALDAAQNLTDRLDALEVRDYFVRSNEWERRRIISLMAKTLPTGEYAAWRRAIRTYIARDPLASAIK